MSTFNLSLSKNEKKALVVICLITAIALYYGWRLFWFMTDDAYIAFRYVSNSMLGYGYVWNAPPFRPVEGYTSFLWVVILDVIWRVAGIEPPDIANWLALGFSILTLALVTYMILLMEWGEKLRKHRLIFLVLVLLGTLTNRTFLAWTSSGLETSMFNFFVTLWLFCSLYLPRNSRLWVFGISLSVLLIYLTRPDGVLFAGITIAMLMVSFWERRLITNNWMDYIFAFPLFGIPIHFLWRKSFYGVWLPNTYYAKVIEGRIWWESGYRYLLSFVIEYSLWFWLALLLIWSIYALRNVTKTRKVNYHYLIQFLAVLALLGHFLYYTILVGGDYFEFRVYSHLIPFLFLSFVWFLSHLQIDIQKSAAVFLVFIIFSWPIPWMHWSLTQNMATRDETLKMIVPVAGAFERSTLWLPGPAISYLNYYDGLQAWLINHYVCVRHQELKSLWLRLEAYFPTREAGEKLKDNYPVLAEQAVGVIGWVLPNVNIIDMYGLNDYIIARNPTLRSSQRMAHLRQPPDGYVDCFLPNVKIKTKKAYIVDRQTPLSSESIVNCEDAYLQIVLSQNQLNP